jgi:hypothetical protein
MKSKILLKQKSDRLLKEKIFEEVEIFFIKKGTGKRHAVDKSLINAVNEKIKAVLDQPSFYELESKRRKLLDDIGVLGDYSPEMELLVDELKETNTRLFFWLTQEEQREFCIKQTELEEEKYSS